MAAVPTGIRIELIHNQKRGSRDLNDEYVMIVNDGTQRWDLAGWLVTDETSQQLRPHEYRFPAELANGQKWYFDPGEAIYLRTGSGQDVFIAKPSRGRPQFHFYWDRRAFVWNNSGDRVYVRHPNGTWATQPFPIP